MQMEQHKLIELRDISKRYDTTTVLEDMNLYILKNEFITLLGPSGCGKTTMLRIIAGFEKPTSGSILFDDRVVSSDTVFLQPEKRDIGMVFQSYAVWPHMTVFDNVAYPLTIKKVDKATIKRKVERVMEAVHLIQYTDRIPSQLSGGQQQRVALARALIVEPETLLLDEPLSNLDANLREEMRFEIRRLHDEYRYTTIYVTHDQSEAMTTADLIAVMNGGRIDQLGTPEDIYARPVSEFVARFIGASNVIKGSARDANHVSFAGATLKVVGAPLTAGASVTVAIRQHDIGLSTKPPISPENAIRGVVTRQVYLGAARDYMVEVGDGSSLRATTPTETNVPKGSEVWLTLPPERCRALSR